PWQVVEPEQEVIRAAQGIVEDRVQGREILAHSPAAIFRSVKSYPECVSPVVIYRCPVGATLVYPRSGSPVMPFSHYMMESQWCHVVYSCLPGAEHHAGYTF